MTLHKGQLTLLLTLLWLNFPVTEAKANPEQPTVNNLNCPEPALERLKRHIVASGETLESIASQYNLIPATIMGMNPSLRRGGVQAGSEVIIPPYNGIVVEVPFGETWRDVAAAYKVREILLYEANGCQEDPRLVFVPGVNWSPAGNENLVEDSDLKGYPLPATAPVALGYGWLLHPITRKVFFHSGVDMMATPDTPVLAVGEGVVAFAGERGNYGNMVVVNHQQGQQTRYAHLGTITVTSGQMVRQGEQLGTVGTTGNPDTNSPHLHFEIRYNSDLGWVAEDPRSYLRQTIGGTENPQLPGNAGVSPGQSPMPGNPQLPANVGVPGQSPLPVVVPVPGSTGVLPGQSPKPILVPVPGNVGVPGQSPKPMVVPVPGSAGVPGQSLKPMVVPVPGSAGVPGQSPKPMAVPVPGSAGVSPRQSPKPGNSQPPSGEGFTPPQSTRAEDLLVPGGALSKWENTEIKR